MSQAQKLQNLNLFYKFVVRFFLCIKKGTKNSLTKQTESCKKKKAGLIQILWYFQGSNYIIASLFLLIFRKDVDIWFICMCFQ